MSVIIRVFIGVIFVLAPVSATTFTIGVLANGDAFVDPDVVAMQTATAQINADASILSAHTLALDIREHSNQTELWRNTIALVPETLSVALIGAYLSSDTLKARCCWPSEP